MTVLVSPQVQWGDTSWRSDATMFGHEDLQTEMVYFVPEQLDDSDVPRGALVLTTATVAAEAGIHPARRLSCLERVIDLDGFVATAWSFCLTVDVARHQDA